MSETMVQTFDRVQRSLFDEARMWGEFARDGHREITAMVPADLDEDITLPAPTSVEIVEEDTVRKIEAVWSRDGMPGTGVRFSISEPSSDSEESRRRGTEKENIVVHDYLDMVLYDDDSLDVYHCPRDRILSGLVRYDGSSGIFLADPHMKYSYSPDGSLRSWFFGVSARGTDPKGIRDLKIRTDIKGGLLPPMELVDNMLMVPRIKMSKSPPKQVECYLDVTPYEYSEVVDGAGETEISFDPKKCIGIHIGTADLKFPEAKVLRYRVLDALEKAVGDLRF